MDQRQEASQSRSIVQFGKEHLDAMDQVHADLRGQFYRIVNMLALIVGDIVRIIPTAFYEAGTFSQGGAYPGAFAPDAHHFMLTIQFGKAHESCALGIRVDLSQEKDSVALRRNELIDAVGKVNGNADLLSSFELPEQAKLDRRKALRALIGEDADGKEAPRRERYQSGRSQRPIPAPVPSPATLVDPGMVLGNVKKEAEETPMNGSDNQPQRLTFPYLSSSSDPVDCVVALAQAIHPDASFSYSEFSMMLEAQWPDIFPKGKTLALKALYNARMKEFIREINPSYGKITSAGATYAEKMKKRPAVADASRETSSNPGAKASDVPWTQDVLSLSRPKIVGGIALYRFGRRPFDRSLLAEEACKDHPAIFEEKLFNAKNAISGLKGGAYGWFEDAPGGQLRLTDKGFKALAPLVGLAPAAEESASSSPQKIARIPRAARTPKARTVLNDGPILERYPDPTTAEDACKAILAIGEEVEARKSVRERDLSALDEEIAELEQEARDLHTKAEALKEQRAKGDETIQELEERKRAILKLMPELG